MEYIKFANAFLIKIDDAGNNAAISHLKDEFRYHLILEHNDLPVIGTVKAVDALRCPASAVLLHDKRLYADGDVLYCKDGNSVVRIHLTAECFTLEVNGTSDGGLLVLVMQTLLNWYMVPYGMVFLHAASFKYKDVVYAIHGFGGAGKTEVMLNALERGATYLSDDLAIFDKDGCVHPYLRKISLHDYPFTEEQLERFHLDKRRYRLMNKCRQRNDRLSQYIYQRLRGSYCISINYKDALPPRVNSAGQQYTDYVNETFFVDKNYWLEASDKTCIKNIQKNDYVRKMTFCMQNEFRQYIDFDGYFGIIYDFWKEQREHYDRLLQTVLSKINIQGISIKHGHYNDLANLIINSSP